MSLPSEGDGTDGGALGSDPVRAEIDRQKQDREEERSSERFVVDGAAGAFHRDNSYSRCRARETLKIHREKPRVPLRSGLSCALPTRGEWPLAGAGFGGRTGLRLRFRGLRLCSGGVGFFRWR